MKLYCYEIDNKEIKNITIKEWLEYDNLAEENTSEERGKLWPVIKKKIESNSAKSYKGASYLPYKTKSDAILVFGAGLNKGLIREIYNLESSEETVPEGIDVWNLADETKSLDEHIKAIKEKKTTKGQLSEAQSLELLKKLANDNTKKSFNNKEFDKVCVDMVTNLKEYKDCFEKSKISIDRLGETLKQIKTESKDPNFYNQVMATKDDPVDLSFLYV